MASSLRQWRRVRGRYRAPMIGLDIEASSTSLGKVGLGELRSRVWRREKKHRYEPSGSLGGHAQGRPRARMSRPAVPFSVLVRFYARYDMHFDDKIDSNSVVNAH
jgi:hypothetical protein